MKYFMCIFSAWKDKKNFRFSQLILRGEGDSKSQKWKRVLISLFIEEKLGTFFPFWKFIFSKINFWKEKFVLQRIFKIQIFKGVYRFCSTLTNSTVHWVLRRNPFFECRSIFFATNVDFLGGWSSEFNFFY